MMNRSSLFDRINNLSQCEICYDQYNRWEKQPVIICSMHHTVCRECMNDIRTTRRCPFCRQTINFDNIVTNKYILELLPRDRPLANIRIPAQQRYISIERQPLINPSARELNQQPGHPSSTQNQYYTHPRIYHLPADQSRSSLSCNSCRRCIRQIVRRLEIKSDSYYIYNLIFIVQLPFLFFDLLFYLIETDQKCMDTKYEPFNFTLRQWLLKMAIAEGSSTLLLLVGMFLKVINIISISSLECFQALTLIVFLVRILFWLCVQPDLFIQVIEPHCNGGIFAYQLIQFIISTILICLASAKSK